MEVLSYVIELGSPIFFITEASKLNNQERTIVDLR